MKELVPAQHFRYLPHPYDTCLTSCCASEAASSPARGIRLWSRSGRHDGYAANTNNEKRKAVDSRVNDT